MYYHFNSLNFTITTLEAITINSSELLFKTRQQTQIFIRINVKKSFCFTVDSGYTFLFPVCPPFHLSLSSLIFCSFLGSMHPWKKKLYTLLRQRFSCKEWSLFCSWGRRQIICTEGVKSMVERGWKVEWLFRQRWESGASLGMVKMVDFVLGVQKRFKAGDSHHNIYI